MSGREWKPGDVALVRNEHDVWNVAICRVTRSGLAWYYGVTESCIRLVHKPEARPLVVIDPEDRRQVESLCNRFDGAWMEQSPGHDCLPLSTRPTRGNVLQAALREFADPKPPKPEEPTRLGAVVEDDDGATWIRCFSADIRGSVWRRSGDRAEDRAAVTNYADITAVRVLSEGVVA